MMDRLDRVSIALIVALSIMTAGMITAHGKSQAAGGSDQSQTAKANPAQKSDAAAVYGDVNALIKSARYEEAMAALRKTMEKYPQRPDAKVYMAAIYGYQGDIEKAVSLCRQNIEKNPDLLELAAANLKDMVQNSIPKLKREKELKPNDQKVSALLQDLYFCQRRLGQGCE